MEWKKILRVVLVVSCLTMLSLPLFAESVTLSTYYPAPFGAYDRLKLVPRNTLPLDPYCDHKDDIGLMYYDNGFSEKDAGIYVCHQIFPGVFDWVLMSGFLPPKEEKIKKDKEPARKPVVSRQKVICIGPDGKMGVCLNNPSADGTCACQQGDLEKSGK